MDVDGAPDIGGVGLDWFVAAIRAPRLARRRGNRLARLKFAFKFLRTIEAFE